ncbi:hypothetical protein C0431_00055 [bacterium]|nr:hypothetical protein [bacterium]
MKRSITTNFKNIVNYLGIAAETADRLISHRQSKWIRNTKQDTVIVFVHGFLSKGEKAWSTRTSNWFTIIQNDPELNHCDIFQAEWYTTSLSGRYDLEDAAKSLLTELATPHLPHRSIWEYPNIVMVGHSMGGIVIRKVLIEHPEIVTKSTVKILTLSTPATGVNLINHLLKWKWLPRNAMLQELQPTNEELTEVHKQFQILVENHAHNISGIELYESHLVAPRHPSLEKVYATLGQPEPLVPSSSQGNYFGSAVEVPNSDHRSISRPTSSESQSHHHLKKLILVQMATTPASPLSAEEIHSSPPETEPLS